MSDAPQAPGWWQASDGRWYPPEQAPGTRSSTPGYPPQDGPGAPPAPGYPSGGYPPAGGAGGAPAGGYPPPGGYGPSGYGPPGGYSPSGYPSVPPPTRSSGTNGCLVAFLVALAVATVIGLGSCVALVVVADDVAEDVEADLADERADEADDVSEPRCERGELGDMRAVMTVTNDSSKRSNYTIEVVFTATNGDQLDTGLASVSALAPGQSTEATASSVVQGPGGDFTCDVVDVQRFSDEP